VLLSAVEAVTKVQHGYVGQVVADAKAMLASKELPKPESVKAAGEKAVAVTKEVVDLTVATQKRVFELFSARGKANVAELKVVAA
jgi:hypothetical protein